MSPNTSDQYTGWLAVLDHWQSLSAGLLALVAALLTMIMPWRQNKLLKAQQTISSRDHLLARISAIEARRAAIDKLLSQIISDANRELYFPVGELNEVEPDWAHDSGQRTGILIDELLKQQGNSIDGSAIDDKRDFLLVVITNYQKCLFAIVPANDFDLEDPELQLTEEDKKRILAEPPIAEKDLPGHLESVIRAESDFRSTVDSEVAQLRKRVREIDRAL